MDGSFVNNISYGPKFVTDLLKDYNKEIDSSAHLMIRNAYRFLDKFSSNPPKRIVFHIEDKGSMKNIKDILNFLLKWDIKFGVALNPETSVSEIDKKIMHTISEILIMTVNPGKGGQELLKSSLHKTIILQEMKKSYNFDYSVTIDGGVNKDTIGECAKYPIDQFVVGSYVWKNLSQIKENLGILMKEIKKVRL